MTTDTAATYLEMVVQQLTDTDSVTLTKHGLAWLVGAVAKAPGIPHDDYETLWRALHHTDPDLASRTWQDAWNDTEPKHRIALVILAARIPDLDRNQGE